MSLTYILFIGVALFACTGEETVAPATTMTWTYFKTTEGLASNFIYSFYEDRNGTIWIGTDKGVSVFDRSGFKNYTTNDGLVSNVIYATTEASNGDIWVGTANGVGVFSKGKWYYYSALNGIVVYTLITDSSNIIWLGTKDYGIIKSDGTDFRQALDNTCSACNIINNIYEDRDKQIWIGSDGDVKLFVKGSYKSFTTNDGVTGKKISVITQDLWGNMWMGTRDDLKVNKYIHGKFVPVSLSNITINFNWVLGMQVDNVGQLWIGTVSNGLISYDGVIARKQFTGPPGKSITAVMKDSKGDMWIGTGGNGVGRFTPVKLQ